MAYLQWCQTLYPDKKLLFLWDGASYHRGEEMQKFLAQENAGLAEADWKVTCMRFAPNAPEQNPTEDVWLKGKTHLRKQFALNKTFAPVKRCFSTFLTLAQFYFDEAQLVLARSTNDLGDLYVPYRSAFCRGRFENLPLRGLNETEKKYV